MMAYRDFAFFYDVLNEDADYERLSREICRRLKNKGVENGILVDLGCGTGELTLRLSDAGYDMVGVDLSSEMLSIASEKQGERSSKKPALFLRQDITQLDLYGTVRGMISTFDTLNHLAAADLETAFSKIALFMEKDAVFIFDMNTPYKHLHILKNHLYILKAENDGLLCRWKNTLDKAARKTTMDIQIERDGFAAPIKEKFCEYYYYLEHIQTLCGRYGLDICAVEDGETFGPLRRNSQRMLITAVKRYTQKESGHNGSIDT
ncbi:MAG: class I SAM-dependent methyltransferase [Oscillospiraceae bacterium]|nr:class I SAM-dependent methyltransferase [Oscillospiraceae bacterium]